MIYRKFGNTGFEISSLGFGAMRLPHRLVDGKAVYDHDAGVELIRQAFQLGVNYVDSAFYYCGQESEVIVGKALKGWRDRVQVSTKLPLDDDSTPAYARETLETSLRKLDVDCIDFYHLWGIEWEFFDRKVRGGILDTLLNAKSEGMIRHLSFSTHDKPENIIKLVDEGCFGSMLCQYNLLDRANEPALTHARAKGLGTVVMGPVGGGRLGAPSAAIRSLLPGGSRSSAEIALRFVLSNPDVCCALSGMEKLSDVEENVAVASRPDALTGAEREQVLAVLEEKQKLADLYCTGCAYCMPCPHGVDIPENLSLMNLHRIYGATEYAKKEYRQFGHGGRSESKPARDCTECGLCEEKCPQKLEIRKKLKETDEAIGR